ncbi:hypothetical protein OEZ60_00045 [Defluviimonas sp. WL0024]|uniref:Tetratricopeptide repeat-containing protein n=1 Tax=Albidovulum salinarum TaxID=2984153 RepID=A0ABT2WY46_9RHOB|nr:hypothetical protein [Defluviimonas sp. WL0024]MCU9846394.1 hypothetical protein [Defluviimonas sp. WL0024]
MDDLSRFAVRHGTDKFGLHHYTPVYHRLFGHLRNRPVRLLEIGVGGFQDEDRGGHSLAMWRDYFPNGEITSLDIHKKTIDLGPRVKIFQGSQIDEAFLREIQDERGPFDIIIDDGSHRNDHVLESYRILWTGLTPGGYYAIEDLQTAFFPQSGGSIDLTPPNSVGYFADVFEKLGSDRAPAEIRSMVRVHNIVVLQKVGGADECMSITEAEYPLQRVDPNGDWREAFARIPSPGALMIDGSLDGQDLVRRFIEVDHREIAVHFPETKIDPAATEIFAIQRDNDGILVLKAPNDYPSNFKFDAKHHDVSTVLDAMLEAVRQDPEVTNEGISNLAELVASYRSLEEVEDLIDQLEAKDVRTRAALRMRVELARRRDDSDKLSCLLAISLEQFPAEPRFHQLLADHHFRLGKLEAALEAIETSRKAFPRVRQLGILHGRILSAMSRDGEAIAVLRELELTAPDSARIAIGMAKAKVLQKAQRFDEAETCLMNMVDGNRAANHLAYRLLCDIRLDLGRPQDALSAIDQALELAPEVVGYQRIRARISESLKSA